MAGYGDKNHVVSPFYIKASLNAFSAINYASYVRYPEDHKFSPEDHKFSLEDHKFSLEDHKFSPEDHKFSPEDHKFSPEDHKFFWIKNWSLLIISTFLEIS